MIRRKLLAWYDENARDLPWRRTRDPYAIWVAEIMLQQTRVETVIPYYARFLERFPDVSTLAGAELDQVLAMWSGLGYYRRARLLHRGARHVLSLHDGSVPDDAESIREIPGVGAYTTGAIASQAFGREEALVDGNVARVLSRVFAVEEDPKRGAGLRAVWGHAAELVRGERPGALNNALMELGATVCVPREPRCLVCPIRSGCAARKQGRERELPVTTEKAARPRVREYAAVLRVRDAAGADDRLLARRAGEGLFAGMWEPPRVAAKDRHQARSLFSALLGVDVVLEDRAVRRVQHVLTHRLLDVTVHEGILDRAPHGATTDYDALALVPLDALGDRGVSTLARKLLGRAT